MKDLIVQVWQIKGYIKVDKYLRDLLRNKFKQKYGSLRQAEIFGNFSDYHHRRLHKKYTRSDILLRLLDLAEIPKEFLEKHTVDWSECPEQKKYKIEFPLKINPLHTRMAAHIIGDGSITAIKEYKEFSWWQKDISPMEKLQCILFGISLKNQKNKIIIPKINIKLINAVVNLDMKKLNKEGFLKACLQLPREHKVEILTAIVEDEGSFDKNRLIIRMSDGRLMVLICHLIDSLKYDRTKLRTFFQNSTFLKKKTLMYRTDLNIRAIKTYHKDLEKLKQRYGKIAGLWTKDRKLEELSKNSTLMDGYDRHKVLIPKVLERFLNKRRILFLEIKKTFNLTDNETVSILRCMINKNLIKRIKKGVYIFNR